MHKTFTCLFLFTGLTGLGTGQQQMEVAGRLPAAVPEDGEIVARVITDMGQVIEPVLSTARVEGGEFELTLPAQIDAELLEEERMGCGDEDLLDLAFLPYLLVELGQEVVGRLVLTDMPRELWRFGLPAKHAYFVYVAEDFASEEECGSQEIAISLKPGWNPLLTISDADGMRLTSEPAPDSFRWHFDPH